ncbi:hypothetical protein PSTT_08653 [Puccinia striiformis]|uniref:Uncharacterized protein n=1 Tax=Puccinia striiformis TaxID=27350 RepID=A0A2S4VBK3_9BASI|nr:hypothetical protein PSTT_08653 [Puccinia striiformis]
MTAVVSGSWSGGRDFWRVSLRTNPDAATSITNGSTYQIVGSIAYFMPVLIWQMGNERLTRLAPWLADRALMCFSGLGRSCHGSDLT